MSLVQHDILTSGQPSLQQASQEPFPGTVLSGRISLLSLLCHCSQGSLHHREAGKHLD